MLTLKKDIENRNVRNLIHKIRLYSISLDAKVEIKALTENTALHGKRFARRKEFMGRIWTFDYLKKKKILKLNFFI